MTLPQALVIGLTFAMFCVYAAILTGTASSVVDDREPPAPCPVCGHRGYHHWNCSELDNGGPDAA